METLSISDNITTGTLDYTPDVSIDESQYVLPLHHHRVIGKFILKKPNPIRNEDSDDIVAGWAIAIAQREKTLSQEDFTKLQSFSTPDLLLEDIKGGPLDRRNFFRIRRPIQTMKSFLTFFVVTMSPRTLKSSIFWGLVYLLVDVSFDMTEMNNNKLKEDVIEMLEKVTRSLEECKRAHQNTRFDEDLKLILNDAFIALILFWADTVNFMRAYPNGKDEQGTSYDYEREIKKLNGTFDHLKVCATMPESGPNLSVVPSGVPLRSLLPKDLSLPCGKAPYYSDADFYGRQVELEKINSALGSQVDKSDKLFTICGLAGVGKSKLAMAYAKKYARQFDVILWIKA
ncbi:hypothetical protein TGAMA5MH_01478 [Trichoderma gamsii]|uniref:NB-ARC domain-containing protein n=1 Tax=Trichoderma gamsii TaxID=398673 RepID=A0A2K0TQ53_9HYPO|nr:hypothetical protein TGAMA5MH_01478 [Trichoderma gamsii]